MIGGAEYLHQKAVPQASGEPVGRPFADQRHQVPASKQHKVNISARIEMEHILNRLLTKDLIQPLVDEGSHPQKKIQVPACEA